MSKRYQLNNELFLYIVVYVLALTYFPLLKFSLFLLGFFHAQYVIIPSK